VPSSTTSTDNLALIGQVGLVRRNGKGAAKGALLGSLACVAAVASANILLAFMTAGISLISSGGLIVLCGGIGAALGFIAHGLSKAIQPWATPFFPRQRNIGTLTSDGKMYGQWNLLDFAMTGAQPSSSCDCEVTYTCRYGKGWDEVCDNQRWAIDKHLAGNTVFDYLKRADDRNYHKND
jgi:chitinase